MKRNQKPTVLILTSSFPSSPVDETCGYIRDFARAISEEFSVKVLAPPDQRAIQWPADYFALVRSRSIIPVSRDPFQASVDLNNLSSKSFTTRLAALFSLFSYLAHALALSLRADVICSHWMVPCGLIGALISRVFGKQHIVIEHSGALHLLTRMRSGDLIAWLIVAGSERVITVSADLKRKLAALCPSAESRIDVIPMGIDTNDVPARDNGAQAQQRTILFVGRLTEIKGLDGLLEAMAGLDASLIIAGDGEKRAGLGRLARDLGVDATFVGSIDAQRRSELFSFYSVVVIPSRVLDNGRTEGLPVVCLEAMAAGKVVIASSVGGLPEIIIDGENGVLFDASDHRLLREKLMLVLSDVSLRKRISENARRTAEGYDWSKIGLRFGHIIKRCLFESHPRQWVDLSNTACGEDRQDLPVRFLTSRPLAPRVDVK